MANIPNCYLCDVDENDHLTLLCAQCEAPYHTYCLGLDGVPPEAWYCQPCTFDLASQSAPPRLAPTHRRRAAVPNTKQARRENQAVRRRTQHGRWESAWQSVWAGLNADLDNQSQDHDVDVAGRGGQQSRELEQWTRRLGVARRQGNRHRFGDTAPLLLGRDTGQTEEEISSWEMLAEAEKLEEAGLSTFTPKKGRHKKDELGVENLEMDTKTNEHPNMHKRTRSRTGSFVHTSPIEPERKRTRLGQVDESSQTNEQESIDANSPHKERKLKRPMTRRNILLKINEDTGKAPSAESLTSSSDVTRKVSKADIVQDDPIPTDATSPGLLESLLDDISKAKPSSSLDRIHLSQFSPSILSPGFDNSMITPAPSPPRMASPVSSDIARGRASSESISRKGPEQHIHFRKQKSPHRLSSLENVYSRTNDLEHSSRSPLGSDSDSDDNHVIKLLHCPQPLSPELSPGPPLPCLSSSPPPPPPAPSTTAASRPPQASNLRTPAKVLPNINICTKNDIEKMVRNALTPHYRPGGISKEDFSNINKSISRKLYSMVVVETGRIKDWEKGKWQKMAEEEVQREVDELKNAMVE